MPGQFDFTGQNIKDTYKRVIQYDGEGNFYDGTGSLINGAFPGSSVDRTSQTYTTPTLSGSTTISGHMIPSQDGVYDLGSDEFFFRTASIEHIQTLNSTITFIEKSVDGGGRVTRNKRGDIKIENGAFQLRDASGQRAPLTASLGLFSDGLKVEGTSTFMHNIVVEDMGNNHVSIATPFTSSGPTLIDEELTITGDVTVVDANITADAYYGDGSNLTGIVSSIVAGSNITLSPSEGTGDVTIGLTPQTASLISAGLNTVDTSINYNVSTAISVQFGQNEYNQGDSLTVDSGSNSSITVSQAGYYRVDALVAFNTGGQRTTPGMNVYVDGVEKEGRSYGYIRNASGATEASCTINRIIYLPNGTEEITIKVANFGASGTCNAQQGYFQLTKIDNPASQGPEGPDGPTGQAGTSFSVSLETTGKTLGLSDNLTYIKCSPSSPGATYTVPPQSDVSWPSSCEIAFEQGNAFPITIAAGTGVTVNSSATLVSSGQNAVMALKRVDTNVWTLTGERATS